MNKKSIEIKKLADDISLLYVEDNVGLSETMTSLLGNMFNEITVAHDGEEGYNKYLECKSKIIITDINMPKKDGFEMIKDIKELDPDCKFIVMSALNEVEHLHKAIDLGVFRYISKPAKAPELIAALYDTLTTIIEEENRNIFNNQIQNIFNYQNNLVVMMHKDKFIFPNKRFLDFFGVKNLEEFTEKYNDIDSLLLEHKEFLYTTSSSHWYDTIAKNPGKLYHSKIKNSKNQMRHLILKLREVPQKSGYNIISFDDITELNLMGIYDNKETDKDTTLQNKMAIITLMQVIQNNASEVKLHNYYKGLTIVHPAVIIKTADDHVVLKTDNTQLKIINMDRSTTISSDLFPNNVFAKINKDVDFDNQTITIYDMYFSKEDATKRENIRLEPEEEHSCKLFYKDIMFAGEVHIVDISENSIKVNINALPAGMIVDTHVKLSMNLNLHKGILSLVTDATVYSIEEKKYIYQLVLKFELEGKNKEKINEYLVHRQMTLIREFKKTGLNYEI